jgi:hypothetical protein
MHFGEPSAQAPMDAVQTDPVQNDTSPVASFIAALMPFKQVDVIGIVAQAEPEPEWTTA